MSRLGYFAVIALSDPMTAHLLYLSNACLISEKGGNLVILECILCDPAMSNDCGGHIVWVRSGLLTYYVGTQKPALDHMSKHTICHAAEREAGLLSGENISTTKR